MNQQHIPDYHDLLAPLDETGQQALATAITDSYLDHGVAPSREHVRILVRSIVERMSDAEYLDEVVRNVKSIPAAAVRAREGYLGLADYERECFEKSRE